MFTDINYHEKLERQIVLAKETHPSLVNTFLCTKEEFQMEERVKHFLPDFDIFEWDADDASYKSENTDDQVQGVMSILVDQENNLRTAIFLKKIVEPQDEQIDDNINCAMNLFYFFHELGHVDDFEKQINIKDRIFNAIEGEIYADGFAFQKLIEGNHIFLIKLWISQFEEWSRTHEKEYRRKVCAQFIESDTCQECRRLF